MKKDGTEFPMVLKVSELVFGADIVYVGVIKNVSYEKDLLNIRYVYIAWVMCTSDLLSNMLPHAISQRVQRGEKEIADEVDACVMFLDLCDYNKDNLYDNAKFVNLIKRRKAIDKRL